MFHKALTQPFVNSLLILNHNSIYVFWSLHKLPNLDLCGVVVTLAAVDVQVMAIFMVYMAIHTCGV